VSSGDALSLGAIVALIFGLAWLIDSRLRGEYRDMRAAGTPRVVAIPAAVLAALINGC